MGISQAAWQSRLQQLIGFTDEDVLHHIFPRNLSKSRIFHTRLVPHETLHWSFHPQMLGVAVIRMQSSQPQSPAMSTHSDSAFSTALQQSKDGLDHAEKQSFKLVKLEDLLGEISNLQARLLRQRRGKNLARLRPFLEAIDQLGKVVEVFANSSEFVAFVWVGDLALQQNLIAQYLRTRAIC